MRVSYSTLVKAKRAGRATSVRVAPTGTAVTDYQVPLGNRHSLKEAGVIGLPSWSDKTTQSETWTKVPRLSATCPRRVVAFDGGRADIDRTFEFGDEFDGSALNGALWTSSGTVTVSGGIVTCTNALIRSKTSFGVGYAGHARSAAPGYANMVLFADATYTNQQSIDYDETQAKFRSGPAKAGSYYPENTQVNRDTAYHHFAIARISANETRYYVDGLLGPTLTNPTYIPTDDYPIGIRTWVAGKSVSADLAFVRKYVANEPLTGTAKPSATNRALSRPMSRADLIRACCT